LNISRKGETGSDMDEVSHMRRIVKTLFVSSVACKRLQESTDPSKCIYEVPNEKEPVPRCFLLLKNIDVVENESSSLPSSLSF